MPRNNSNTSTVEVPRTRESALAEFPEMVLAIPAAEDSDGSEIVADILMATTWEDLAEEQGSLPNARAVAGRQLRVHKVERRESTEAGGLGWYLVIDSTDPDTGEMVKWQTSAMSVMAKLVKLHQLCGKDGRLDALVETREAERTTKAGRKPIDLLIHACTPIR